MTRGYDSHRAWLQDLSDATMMLQSCYVSHPTSTRRQWQRSLRSSGSSSICMASQNENLQVVITGGSKGLGFAMAREFLSYGDQVLICGRDADRLHSAHKALSSDPGCKGKIHMLLADVSNPKDMDQLAKEASIRLPNLTHWINNAGSVTSKRLLADVESADIVNAVGANVLGSLLGRREAIKVMRDQMEKNERGERGGLVRRHIFNLGFSSWGASFSKTAATHKMTKRSLTQLTISLAEELKASKLPIGAHNLSPGLVLTDLLLRDSSPVARRFFNTLADEPEIVASVLVPKIRSVSGRSTSIEYLSPLSAITRVVSGLPLILHGGKYFDRDGNRVVGETGKYKTNGVRVPYEIDDLERY